MSTGKLRQTDQPTGFKIEEVNHQKAIKNDHIHIISGKYLNKIQLMFVLIRNSQIGMKISFPKVIGPSEVAWLVGCRHQAPRHKGLHRFLIKVEVRNRFKLM